jgi:hypothetical protein
MEEGSDDEGSTDSTSIFSSINNNIFNSIFSSGDSIMDEIEELLVFDDFFDEEQGTKRFKIHQERVDWQRHVN